MKRLITYLLLFFLSILSHVSWAQLSYQTGGFSTSVTTYTDISSLGTAISMSNNDTGHSAPQPIGFSFIFNGVSYDSFVMYVDGLIKLGNLPASSANAMLFTAWNQPPVGGPFNNSTVTGYTAAAKDTCLIVPFGGDYYGAVGDTVTPTFYVYTTGSPGSQVCTIQWTNLSDKTLTLVVQGTSRTVKRQYDTMNFQVRLYENNNAIEFVYGYFEPSVNTTDARFAACGIKGNDNSSTAQLITLTKASSTSYSLASPNSQASGSPLGNYNTTTSNALNNGNNVPLVAGGAARPLPDVGRTYNFTPVTNNDIAVKEVYSMGKIAMPCYIPDSIRAYITNPGLNAQTGITVYLDITGANSYSTTATISSLASGAGTLVSFAPYTPTNYGESLLTISVGSDDNNNNNTGTYGYSVSDTYMGYTDTLKSAGQSQGTTVPNFWGTRYTISGSRLVTQVRSFLVSNSNAVGDTVAGMILDTMGNILGRSPSYIVTNSDIGNWITFDITYPPTITNGTFIAGIAGGTAVNSTYYLGTYQLETPIRPNNKYFYSITGASQNMTSGITGVNFGTPNGFGIGRLMMECTVDPLPDNDVGVSATSPANALRVPTNTNVSLIATVKNYGLVSQSSGIQVWYSVNGGTVVGPETTSIGINPGDTTSVVFTGSSALNFSSAGTYKVKVYTDMSGDGLLGNDTLVVTYTVVAPVSTFPYRIANGILSSWIPINNSSQLWNQKSATQANGVTATTVLYMDNVNISGLDAKMASPIFDFTNVTNPTMHFNVAYAPNTTTGRDDTLQILVSTDGGTTYTPVYTRNGQTGSPMLGTVAAQSTTYTPASASDWRHEVVDLSSYAGNPYVIVALRGVSALGNNVYIGNIVISDPATRNNLTVTSAGTYTDGDFSINFSTTVGPFGSNLSVSKYTSAPYSAGSPVYNSNTTATTNSGNIFTPTNVSADNWWTVTYDGVGTGYLASTIDYSIYIDLSHTGGIPSPDELYILKRSSYNAPWTTLSTQRSGSVIYAGPVTGFSDFAIASQPTYNPLPVNWLDISAKKMVNDVLVNWSTASEKNTDYFEVERSFNGTDFFPISQVMARGNSSSIQKYGYVDDNIAGVKVAYYRIKQVDHDGFSSYSKIVSVTMVEIPLHVLATPNPFTSNLSVFFTSSMNTDAIVSVTDLMGREVYNNTINASGHSELRIPELDRLQTGLYTMRINVNDNVYTIKLSKL